MILFSVDDAGCNTDERIATQQVMPLKIAAGIKQKP